MKHIWSHYVKLTAVAAMIAAGFTHAVQADPYTPYRGEDGIYHYDWFHQSFLEFEGDIQDAQDEGLSLLVKFDQKGCIYCEKMALEIFAEPAINDYMRANFLVVQLDLFGNRDVTDLDGTTMAENELAQKWGVIFTPTIYFVKEQGEAQTLPEAAIAQMPGAFGKLTFMGMLKWVHEGHAEKGEPFQKYLNNNMADIRAALKAARAS